MNYPLHLGVTEAGEGEDGRIKSAVGIATLLEDGLGDTVRVSLTEEPEFEIPVAKALVSRYSNRNNQRTITPINIYPINPFEYNKRITHEVLNIGGTNPPRVVADFSKTEVDQPSKLFRVGYNYSIELDKWNITDQACDYIYIGKQSLSFEIPGTLGIIQDAKFWNPAISNTYPLFSIDELNTGEKQFSSKLNFLQVNQDELTDSIIEILKNNSNWVLVISTVNTHVMPALRRLFVDLLEKEISIPVIIQRDFIGNDEASFQLNAAADLGGLLIDGLGDGIWLSSADQGLNQRQINGTAFGILQAARVRISKTEYISCPSCGRTLFDLQETTAKIRQRTGHLKGLKIGIMGCIVNGPGEMADADFGYVGTGVGKITLYKGKEVVKRNVVSENAVEELIDLIKEHGCWSEPVI
jgi:(E)-4-hydroxy-3-methylbut-2-enyl-diphosphate synthase